MSLFLLEMSVRLRGLSLDPEFWKELDIDSKAESNIILNFHADLYATKIPMDTKTTFPNYLNLPIKKKKK